MRRSTTFWLMVLVLFATVLLRLPVLEQIPPGLHYDEAANAILAGDIGLRGDRPIFISSYTGKETLFFYLAGGVMRFTGQTILALRLTAALVGMTTVAATYWLGRELFAGRRSRGREIGLLAAALLATSFAHLLFSRLGFRAITQPLLQALAIAALLRGVRTQQWRWFVFGGVCLGLTGYTYLAARLFPLVVFVALLPLLWTRVRRRWAQLGVYLGVALAVLTPLLVYFVQHPAAFWVRIGQVSAESGQINTLIDAYITSLGMFLVRGDPYWRFNIPDRSLLGAVLGILAVGGWVWLLTRWRVWRDPVQRSAILLLLTTPLIMILPTALAVGEITPSNLRAIGVMPFIFFLPAAALRELAVRVPVRRPAHLIGGVAVLVLSLSGIVTARAYFDDWANRVDLFYENDADLVAVSKLIDAHDPATPLYVAALHYRHPTVAFSAEQYDTVKWLPGSDALVWPADGKATIVFPHSSPLPAWAESLLSDAERLDGPAGPDGAPLYTAFVTDGPQDLDGFTPVNANVGNLLRLLGYRIEPGQAGDALSVTLLWQVLAPTERGVLPFVHIEDANRYRWGQVESIAYPAEQWEVGETLVQHAAVPLPPGMPTDAYRLHVGLFDADSAEQLPTLDDGGHFAGTTVQIEPITVFASASPPLTAPPLVLDATVLPGLRLLGYERGGATAATGESFWLSLWWQANQPVSDTVAVQLYLRDADGNRTLWQETQPVQGRFPFATWETPLFVRDNVSPTVPGNMADGAYTLELIVVDGKEAIYATDLGPLTITTTERMFDAPPFQTATDATFGGEIALLGYDLVPSAMGEAELTLVWQALDMPSADYTVFIHALNPDGTCCAWQQDSAPHQGNYPTTRWLPGEIVTDNVTIELPDDAPPGEYQIEIGFYIPANGQRLSVRAAGLPDGDFYYLEPVIK